MAAKQQSSTKLQTGDSESWVSNKMEPIRTDGFTEVAWLTVTQPNVCSLLELQRDVTRLVTCGFKRFNCHLLTHWGALVIDWKGSENPHGHLILKAKDDEVERFNSRLDSFDLEKQWRHRNVHIVSWDSKKTGAYDYALRRHLSQDDIFVCPRVYGRCRGGNRCPHEREHRKKLAAPVWE